MHGSSSTAIRTIKGWLPPEGEVPAALTRSAILDVLDAAATTTNDTPMPWPSLGAAVGHFEPHAMRVIAARPIGIRMVLPEGSPPTSARSKSFAGVRVVGPKGTKPFTLTDAMLKKLEPGLSCSPTIDDLADRPLDSRQTRARSRSVLGE